VLHLLTDGGQTLRPYSTGPVSASLGQLVGPEESSLALQVTMDEEPTYKAQDAVQAAIRTTLITGSAGLLFAAVQNTLTRRNIGALGIFTRFGGTIGLFGLRFTTASWSKELTMP
jgi:hypothetical protein